MPGTVQGKRGSGAKTAPWMGHEHEPKSAHGPRVGGKGPLVHSHSIKPKRKLHTGKRHGRKVY